MIRIATTCQLFRKYLYRPRIEGLFARIERWTRTDNGISHWRSISRDNVTTLFGFDENSRIADPYDPRRVFSYLIDLTFDDKGNATRYEYAIEDGTGVNHAAAHEANRATTDRQAQRYLKRVLYGNAQPYFPIWSSDGIETPLPTDWHFHIVMNYGDHRANAPTPTPDHAWSLRPDPFSAYRAGFEVRTYRRCERALLFHSFPEEAGVGADCLVRSTDFRYSDETAPADPRNPIYTFLFLFLLVQIFGSPQKQKRHVSQWQRNRRELDCFCPVLFPFRNLTNQVILHTRIRPLVALRHEFLVKA